MNSKLSSQIHGLYTQLTNRLRISEDVKDLSWQLFCDLTDIDSATFSDFDKDHPYEWFAVVIYLTLLNKQYQKPLSSKSGEVITVNTLLHLVKIHCNDFLLKAGQILDHVTLPSHIVSDVRQLQRTYIIEAAIFDKLNKVFSEVYIDEQPANQIIDHEISRDFSDKKQKIWLLYVYAKEKFFSHEEMEILTSFYLLLYCMTPVVVSTPSFMLKRPYGNMVLPHQQMEIRSVSDNVLKKLCDDCKASFEDLPEVLPVAKELKSYLVEYPAKTLSELRDMWHQSLKPLSINYSELFEVNSLLLPKKNGDKNFIDTPVQNRLGTLHSLKSIVTENNDHCYSSSIQHYLTRCQENPEEQIKMRLNEMRDRFVNAYISKRALNESVPLQDQQHIPRQRFQLVEKLYYKAMYSMLEQEERRLSKQDFTTLLSNDTFHRTLILCATLVVCHAYDEQTDRLENLTWLLETYRVEVLYISSSDFRSIGDSVSEAYYLCKIIECFIKAAPNLHNESIRNLKFCENHILDRIAWMQESPLFDAIQSTKSRSTEILSSEHYPQSAADQFLSSPMKRRPDRPSAENGEAPRSRSLELFLSKVCRLAYSRLTKICVELKIGRDTIQKIWTCLEFCIMSCNEILENRHLDQIMLCSIYSICKIVDQELLFKTIVTAYDRMPYTSGSNVHKQVYIDDRNNTKSIKHFYNQIFLSKMKTHILNFSPGKLPPNLAQAPKIGHSPIKSSPQRIGKYLYLSPMKDDGANQVHMTPRTKRLYCFGDVESSMQLKSLNDCIQHTAAAFGGDRQAHGSSSSTEDKKPMPSCGKRIKFE